MRMGRSAPRLVVMVLGSAGLAASAACGGTGVTGVSDAGADAAADSTAGSGGGDDVASESGGSAGAESGVGGDTSGPGSGGRVEGSGGVVLLGSGGAGTGGLPAVGGAGIGGSPDVGDYSICGDPTVASGTRPLIIDFEGMTVEEYGVAFDLTDAVGLYGGTYTYVGDSVGESNSVYEFVAGPDSDTALSVTFPGSTEWGGGFGFWIDGCPDVSVYSGITFALRSNVASGEVPVYFQVADTRSVDGGGLCDALDPLTCVAASTTLEVTNEWATYKLAWSDFTGGMAGDTPVPVDGSNWIGLEFSIDGVYDTPEDLELAIDDLGFY